eukprot:Platyproteum_vivax@DN6718_c0_g1_i1.p2
MEPGSVPTWLQKPPADCSPSTEKAFVSSVRRRLVTVEHQLRKLGQEKQTLLGLLWDVCPETISDGFPAVSSGQQKLEATPPTIHDEKGGSARSWPSGEAAPTLKPLHEIDLLNDDLYRSSSHNTELLSNCSGSSVHSENNLSEFEFHSDDEASAHLGATDLNEDERIELEHYLEAVEEDNVDMSPASLSVKPFNASPLHLSNSSPVSQSPVTSHHVSWSPPPRNHQRAPSPISDMVSPPKLSLKDRLAARRQPQKCSDEPVASGGQCEETVRVDSVDVNRVSELKGVSAGMVSALMSEGQPDPQAKSKAKRQKPNKRETKQHQDDIRSRLDWRRMDTDTLMEWMKIMGMKAPKGMSR